MTLAVIDTNVVVAALLSKHDFPSAPFIVTPREMLDTFIRHSLNND